MRILIAAKDPERLEQYKDILKKENYTVIIATNKIDVLANYQKQNVDVIVIDLGMPGALETMINIPDKPKVAISGFSEHEKVARAFGADSVITRKFKKIDGLVEAIRYVTSPELKVA